MMHRAKCWASAALKIVSRFFITNQLSLHGKLTALIKIENNKHLI